MTVTRPALRFRFHVDANGCHIWDGCLDDHGYGVVGTNRVGTFKAHRVAYENAIGPILPGMQLDHLCRVRACINPAHLEPVTNAENTRRGARAKLTPAIIAEMRRRRAEGLSYRQLASEFGVHNTTVHDALNGRRWCAK